MTRRTRNERRSFAGERFVESLKESIKKQSEVTGPINEQHLFRILQFMKKESDSGTMTVAWDQLSKQFGHMGKRTTDSHLNHAVREGFLDMTIEGGVVLTSEGRAYIKQSPSKPLRKVFSRILALLKPVLWLLLGMAIGHLGPTYLDRFVAWVEMGQ